LEVQVLSAASGIPLGGRKPPGAALPPASETNLPPYWSFFPPSDERQGLLHRSPRTRGLDLGPYAALFTHASVAGSGTLVRGDALDT
jgi:hypothetical protein